MSHGRHAYNRARRRGGFAGRGQFEDSEFRDFVSHGGVERVWSELDDIEADEREDELKCVNEGWFMCPNHRGGACSPAKFDCPCYRNGMCMEAKA